MVAESCQKLWDKFWEFYKADWCVRPAEPLVKFLFMAPIYTWFLVTDSNGLILGWDRSLSYLKYQLPGFLMPPGIVTLNAMQTELPHPPKDVRLSNAKPHPHQLTTFLSGKGDGLPRQARPGSWAQSLLHPNP